MERLYTLKQAAALLAVSPEFLKKLQRQERISTIKLGRAVRISEDELQRLSRHGLRK